MQRRQFLTSSVSAASAGRILGANDRVVMGLIGCGGRGRYVARCIREAPGVEFGAVCDVYQPNAAKAREWAGPRAQAYGDFRRLLEQKDVDAVLVATPDHWHAIPTVLACQAGKDVYVEKPLAHNVREGRAMIQAARRYKRIVVAGTQHRSSPHFAEAARIVQSGELGEVRYVRVWNYVNQYPNGIGNPPDSEPPEGSTWDRRPKCRSIAPASWRPTGCSGITRAAGSRTTARTASRPCTRSWASRRRARWLLPAGASA
ncbi:MAG: Gfo/Idh/MocA family oxidoreductase [Bryobacterales bacterium]|nr:Gfo/Idh/MocA family oxidoreductase [Bryobacterales bacterium]